ncbi:TonB-dependent siderophore receptor [Rhizobium sp. SSA_523]|uniref:TonB-dependent siderophore receptor n=1 Tax=Rhizobium sp. SSA_523 TaxID=2952477 RepID=UPI0020901988|nr:TonB-dependent siderophore receptor [Rhizobium sp. SSA_523]MCO5731245.1 TonB-dependent siderophore receptor [Rhizobium sp. SSA_523]WKC22217.1 TonB-dependent siderophore receptor [Rhizobium sp. SSA_523]
MTGLAGAKNGRTMRFSGRAALLLASVSLLPAAASAQSSAATGPRLQQASLSYSIAPGSLGSALASFGSRSNLQLLYPADITRSKRTAGVSGTMSPEEALGRLLSGTGLTYRFTTATTVTISGPAEQATVNGGQAGDSLTLAPVYVSGDQTGTGPVEGYVARVTAAGTKTDTPIIETPQAVTVVTSDQIRNQGATSISDSLAYTPSIAMQSGAFSRSVDDLTIRGFNVANGNLGSLRDGMKYQSNVYDGGQEPYGLERIDVLRGAASMLYGQLSPGGVVNAISKRPTTNPLREVNLEFGTYGRKQLSADFGGPLDDEGIFSYRLTGLVRDADNWVDNTPDDKVYIAPALTIAPDAATSLTLLSSYQHFNAGFSTPLQLDDVRTGRIPRDMFLGIDGFDRYKGDSYTIGYDFEHQFDNGLTLRNKARYFYSDVSWDYMMGNVSTLANSGGRLARLASVREEVSYGVTQDTSLEYTFDALGAEHTVLGGFDYYRRSYDSHRYRGAGVSLLDLRTGATLSNPAINYAVDRGSDTVANSYGLYLQDQIKFDDHWVLLLGGRQDWTDSTVRSYQNGRVTDQSDNALTGRAGLVYLFDNGLAPYVSIAQSFQPQAGSVTVTGNPLQPNEAVQYEAGLRYQPEGSNLLLSAAVYDLTQTNLTTTDALGNVSQFGEVRSRGVELEARAEFDNLGLIAAYSYTDARITESALASEIGQQIPLVPRNAVSLWADYKLDDLGLEGVKLGAGMRYTGSTNIFNGKTDAPSYLLVDAMASIDLGKLTQDLEGAEFKVNARNLFDKKFYTCTYSDGCRYGEPLTVTATLSYKW